MGGLVSDIPVLTSEEYTNVTGCLSILSPFHKAIVELSEEKRVSGLKLIPLLKIIEKILQEEARRSTNPLARELGEHLIKPLREKLHTLQSSSIMSLPTLLDPRFKTIGFFSQTKAVRRSRETTHIYLCAPSSSVPCEGVFPKAGEVSSKKRNRLNPSTVKQILFLNKNPLKIHISCTSTYTTLFMSTSTIISYHLHP